MIRTLTLSAAGLAAISVFSETAYAQNAPGLYCAQLIANAETRRQIPRGLLMAIAITESGHDDSPNPYAMNIAGKSHHASGFQEMSNIIASNWRRGVTSIDVGCMQINLKYHGDKFQNLTDLLDSPTNVEYGASYLIKLATERGSWREGVMDYHNKRNPARRNWYGCKVWNNYLRIIHARSGFVPCPKTPTGSSVASTANSGVNNRPLVIAGYNNAQPIHPQPRQTSIPTAQPTQAGYGHLPLGNPLDARAAQAPNVQIQQPSNAAAPAPNEAAPFDIPQARQRVVGTIELAEATDQFADITTSGDARASAFRSVRPVDWSGRRTASENDEAQDLIPATDKTHGGFARSGPSQ